MKTKGNLSKIVSTGMALTSCCALLLFALVMLWSMAAPADAQTRVDAHVMGGVVTSTPASGPPGTKITVTGSGITTNVFPSPTTSSITPIPTVGTVTTGSVTFGYSMDNCNTFNSVDGSNPAVVIGAFTGTFTWPSGLIVGTKYNVCAKITAINGSTGSETLASSDTFQDLLSASVSVDHGSYTVGDNITVSGDTFPVNTSVTVELQSSDGATTTTLGTVTTNSNGEFTQTYTVPKHPLNSVAVVVTNASGSTLATSSSFTIKAKAKSSSPPPTPPPPPQQSIPPPPPVAASTPTPVPTTAPTPVPTDTPVPPTPTMAPTPAPVVTVAPSTPFSNLMGGKLPLMLGIGLATLIALGILFVVGRLVLSKYLAPAPPNLPPSGASPWTLEQDNSLQRNTGIPLETMPLNSPYGPNGGFGPGNGPQPQQVPFNAPYQPVNAGFGPGNSPQPQQVPFNAPYQPVNSGFGPGPGNSPQPQQVPFNAPYAPGNSPQPQLPFPSSNDWLPPSQ